MNLLGTDPSPPPRMARTPTPLAMDARLPRRGRSLPPGRLRLRPPRPADPQPDPAQTRVSRPARQLGRLVPRPGASPVATASGGSGSDPAASATDDDYELRRARTPVPTFVAESVDTHLSRIYAREVKRVGPDALMAWWADVDGCGTTIDQWMTETVAPLLLTLGQLDLCIRSPAGAGRRGHRDPRPTPNGSGSTAASPRTSCPRTCSGGGSTRPATATPSAWSASSTRRRRAGRTLSDHWTDDESTLYDAEGTVLSSHPSPVRPGADRSRLRPAQAAVQEHRPAAVRGRRRAAARVLQPRLGADPLRHDPGPPPAARARGLRPGRRHDPDRPELAPAQEEEYPGRLDDLRRVRRRRLPQGRRRVDPQEQGRPPRRCRPRLGPGPPDGPRRRGAVGPVEGDGPSPTATTAWPRSPRSWRGPRQIAADWR